MSTNFLKTTTAIAAAALLAISCTKEIPQKTYPSEITIDNWEEFVDAPSELLKELMAKQIAKAPQATPSFNIQKTLTPVSSTAGTTGGTGIVDPGGKGGKMVCHHGSVRSWRGTYWGGIGGFKLEYMDRVDYSEDGSGKFSFVDLGIAPVCASYPNTSGVGGGGSLDVLDIVMTQRHILGIETFEQLDITQAPRRYVAADVIDDGVINSLDVDQMAALILGTSTIPTLDIAYLTGSELHISSVTDPTQLGGGIKGNCHTPPSLTIFAIKMGDVTGDNIF